MRTRSSASPSPSESMATPFIDALGHGAGDKRIEILRGIAATGSISQAAREAGVSYKAAWQAIDTLTNLAGVALVQRAVGGAGGGGAVLTAQGTRLLGLAQAFDAARREVHARWLAEQECLACGCSTRSATTVCSCWTCLARRSRTCSTTAAGASR